MSWQEPPDRVEIIVAGQPASDAQPLPSKLRLAGADVSAGNPLPSLAAPPAFQLILASSVLLAANGMVESSWFDAQALGLTVLHATRTAAGGAYALEFDWGRASGAVDVTEVLTPGNSQSLTKDIVERWFRLRVRNTDAVTAFTSHMTAVHGR